MPEQFKGPTCRYGPNGESRVFTRVEDVPAGWLDDPKKHAASSAEPVPEPAAPAMEPAAELGVLPLTREQVIAALRERNIPFKKNAFTKALYNQLLAAVEENEA